MALTDELPKLGDDPTDLLNSIDQFGLTFDPEQSSIFSGIPSVDIQNDGPDIAVKDQPQNQPDGIGVAAPAQGNRNAAQRWGVQAQQPVPNVAQVQEANRVALDPTRMGGSTSRYYTRQLARDILGNRNASRAARDEARLALRFNGAPTYENKGGASNMGPPPGQEAVQPKGYGLSPEDKWQHLFPPRRETGETLPPQVTGGDWANIFGKSGTRANDFGAGTGEHKDERFNPVTGRMEIKPSLIQRIAEA